MESSYTLTRPSMPRAFACAPSAAAPITAVVRAPLSQVDQVQTQAELARILVSGGVSGSTNGFLGGNVSSVKHTDGEGGAPPRGRPV